MKIGGRNISNWWLAGGGVGVVAVIWFYRKSSASAAAAGAGPAGAGSGTDPITGLPYSQDDQTDPITGLTYLQEAQEYGSVQAAEQAVQGGGLFSGSGFGSGGTSGFPIGGDGGSGGTTSPTGTTYTTNAQWAQAVQAGLTGLGYSAGDVAAALGLFFAQHPLSAAQASIIQTAEAEYGPPPQGTYPIIGGGGGGGTVGGFQAYAPGGKSLAQLAALYPGETAADLEKMNPGVFRQYGSNPLPKGTGYWVPKETVPAT
jgi:hypothetical protein